MTELIVDIRFEDGDPVVVLNGELDAATTASFEAALVEAAGGESAQVTVDASELTFCDSSGLRSLLSAPGHRPLILRSPSERLLRLLKITNTAERFDIT
jgi:anti-anti-sigma factor